MVLRELHFFLTHLGVLVGSIALMALWLLLAQLSKRGRTAGAVIARSLRRPLIVGFGSALYLGWIGRFIAQSVDGLDGTIVLKISLSLFIASVGWGIGQLGNAVMETWFEDWLQIEDQADEQMLINLIQRLFTILVAVGTAAALMVNFGVSTQAVATVLGGAGIGIGFGTQQISQNFLSGFMLFFNKPFKQGDWINASGLEGTVEKIGWYHTRIRTFDRRPLYIPNSLFATNAIENPGRMYNRRIKADIALRYEDIPKVETITQQVRDMLSSNPDIDWNQPILVHFNEWNSSCVNMLVYCFTRTTRWKQWLDIQQSVFLKIAAIVEQSGARFAMNCTTFYSSQEGHNPNPEPNLDPQIN
ncbi:MAG: mechanosensitive ion channel family protein [Synechococcus sp.]